MNYSDEIYTSYKAVKNNKLNDYNLNSIFEYGLDLNIRKFLENYYSINDINEDNFGEYLSLWQYEALLLTVDNAIKKTLFYKKLDIDCKEEIELLRAEIAKKNNRANSKKVNDIKKIEHEVATKDNYHAKIQALLNKIPFTQASDIIDNSMSFLAIPQDKIEGLVSVESSGTTSNNTQSKRIYCSEKDFESTIQFFFFGMQYLLRNQEDRVAMLMSGERVGSIGHLFSIAMQRLGIACEIIGFSTDYAKIANTLIEYKATCVIGIPWHVYAISSFLKKNKKNHSIKKILLSGDTASSSLKMELAKNLHCEVFNHYGITEFGFAGAVECMEHKALHLRAIDLYIEIIDENLKNVDDDSFGEIVVTTLTREAMPLLRYRTGDRGRIIPKKCPCGSLVPCIEVQGRISQQVIITDKISLHFSDFQDFFYLYDKMSITDFDLCLFSDIEKEEKYLLIGLDFAEYPEKEHKVLHDIKKEFNKHFQIDKVLNYESYNNGNVEKIYFYSMPNYIEIFKKNAYNMNRNENQREKAQVEALSFDEFLKQKEAEKKNVIITAKKNIRKLQGRFIT